MIDTDTILEMTHINISFSGVHILKDADLVLKRGQVNILLGENGAGKSTLMKVLTGAYHKDSGEIRINGEPVTINNAADAEKNGISMIYQEFNLIPNLSVAENIFLGKELVGFGGKVDFEGMNREAQKILDRLHVAISPKTKVGKLGVAQQQMVEIAKALSVDAKIVIMDEPTSALTDEEIENLFAIVNEMKTHGVSIIYISHRLEEFKYVGDYVTTMRDGSTVGLTPIAEASHDRLVQLMVGREIKNQFPHVEQELGSELLRVSHLSNAHVHDVSLTVHAGEIVGIAGLMGAGRTEIARAIYGIDPIDEGEIFVAGKKVKLASPADAIAHHVGFVTENRRDEGLIMTLDINQNITLPALRAIQKNRLALSMQKERQVGAKFMHDLDIKAVNGRQKAGTLSGGNQQKVVIAKWLEVQPQILMMDEPTRGIDVGAKYEIYTIMNELKKHGVGILMISSELPEVIGMSDRILTMREGQLTGELDRGEATQEKIMTLATSEVE